VPGGLHAADDFRCIAALRSVFPVLMAVVAVLHATTFSFAQTAKPSVSSASDKPDDALLPTDSSHDAGRSIFPSRSRPLASEVPHVACSFVAPVCVHAAANVRDVSVAHVLAAAERFYRVEWALRLPEPLPDGGLGGDDRFDIYLMPNAGLPETIPDWMPAGSIWDRSSAFTILAPPLPPFGCDAEATIARALSRAAVFHIDAGIEDAAMGMAETYLADIVTDCATASITAVDDFQRFPERTLGFRLADETAGSFLFARFLDDTYGSGVPGDVLFSLLSVAAQHANPLSLHFVNEPDLFDALRSNARARSKPFDDLLLEFAINRAFVGSRSDDGHLVDVDKYGDAGRVRFEWTVSLATLPRRLAPKRPIEATGTTYIWLDVKDAPENVELAFVADWEAGVLFHWAIVKVDAQGIEMGRITVAGIRGSTHAERSIIGLRGVAGLIVVGVNVGSIDRGHPFDPDETEMARSYTVTLAK
jgi:hypothetical protein